MTTLSDYKLTVNKLKDLKINEKMHKTIRDTMRANFLLQIINRAKEESMVCRCEAIPEFYTLNLLPRDGLGRAHIIKVSGIHVAVELKDKKVLEKYIK